MRTYKKTICLVLLAVLIGGLMPTYPVYAAGNTDYLDTPTGKGTNYTIKGENIDMYLDAIRNFSTIDTVYTSENNHTNEYSNRLKGLSALMLNGENLDEYSTVIGVAMSDSAFSDVHGTQQITIGSNKVKFNLNEEANAAFLHRSEIKSEDPVQLEKYTALSRTAAEFIYYADTWRKGVNDYMSTHQGTIRSSDVAVLKELHEAFIFASNGNYDSNGKTNEDNVAHFDFICQLWLTLGADGDLGLSELYEKSLDPTNVYVDNAFGDLTVEHEQPLHNFYKVNDESGLSHVDVPSLASGSGSMNKGEPEEDPDLLLGFIPTPDFLKEESAASSRSYVTIGEAITQGTAYSAGYVPMQTNMYDTSTINGYDNKWLTDWHYKYGFNRKALFYDTSATSAMDYYNSLGNNKGDLKLCTLREFIELGEKDLTLYIDEQFYNSKEAEDLWKTTVSEDGIDIDNFIKDLDAYLKNSYGKNELSPEYVAVDANFINDTYKVDLTTMDEKAVKDLMQKLKRERRINMSALSFESIVKTGKYKSYSVRARSAIVDILGEYIANAVDTLLGFNNYDTIVMSSYDIADTLDGTTTRTERGSDNTATDYEYTVYDEYTPSFPFAYVSAIYRDKSAFKVSTLNELDTPVFIASDDVAQVPDATAYDRSSLLNYMLVRNLPSMVQINYTYSMDMDSPVYMDIYGNIITESGLVVIPAASNATLYPDDYSNSMYSIGLFTCYGNDYHVPSSMLNVEELLSSFFKMDEENEVWIIDGKGVSVNGQLVDFANIDAYVSKTQEALTKAFSGYIYSEDISGDHSATNLIWTKWVNLINEVMRGAPLEHINKDAEGLRAGGSINKTSIVAAAKLESLINSLKGTMSNTLLSIPDFTTMEQSEYVIAFLFKLLLVAIAAIVIVQIYRDAASGQLGLHTFLKMGSAVGLTFICVTLIPAVFQLTYYAANKLLLQDEVTKICMYNLEKSQSGVEIGVTETTIPDTSNKLMVQLDWITVPWYDEINELLFGTSIESVDIARKKAQQSSAIANMPDVKFYNDGVYMDVEDIFSSVGIDYTFNVGELSDNSDIVNGLYIYDNGTNQSLSYYSPYYVFLKALTANVNSYNKSHDSYMYTTKLQSGNRLKTVGLSQQYFTSENFMELDPDILHLYEIYDLPKEQWYDNGLLFYDEEIELMKRSTWFNELDRENVQKRLDIVNEYCRDFIAENRELLDKVTDETFIKVMALSMSMKYNQVFGITEANCFEIFNMDSNDLLRLSVAKTSDAMLTSPMSYARFVLTTGGESGVYAASILTMIMYVGSFIKPLCVILSYISVFMSVFIFRVVLRQKTKSLLGYTVTVILLGATNFLHAVILKVSTFLPSTGISVTGAICAIIVFQILYLCVIGYVTGIALRDWQNLGATKYIESFEATKAKLSRKNSNHLSSNIKRYDDNWDYYNTLVKQHRERNDD